MNSPPYPLTKSNLQESNPMSLCSQFSQSTKLFRRSSFKWSKSTVKKCLRQMKTTFTRTQINYESNETDVATQTWWQRDNVRIKYLTGPNSWELSEILRLKLKIGFIIGLSCTVFFAFFLPYLQYLLMHPAWGILFTQRDMYVKFDLLTMLLDRVYTEI